MRADRCEHRLEVRLGHQKEGLPIDAETVGAQLDLAQRLLAGDVEQGAYLQTRAHLRHQRRLADARVTADEHEGALDDAATEDAVELADSRRDARFALDRDICKP